MGKSGNKKNSISHEKRLGLFKKYIEPRFEEIKSLVKYYTNHKHNVDDDFCHVVGQIWKYIHTYNETKPIHTWIHIVTKRTVQNRNKERYEEFTFFSELATVKNVDNEDVMDEAEVPPYVYDLGNYEMHIGTLFDDISDETLKALMKIPSIKLSAFLLRFQGYSIGEITKIELRNGHLEKYSEEIIKNRIFQVRHELRDLLRHKK